MKHSIILLLGLTLFISCHTQRKKGPVPKREYYPEFTYAQPRGYEGNKSTHKVDTDMPDHNQNGKTGIEPTRRGRIKNRKDNGKDGQQAAFDNGTDHHKASGLVKNKRHAPALETREESEQGNSDYYLYMIAGLMGASAFGLFRRNRKTTLNVTRWAKANKIKSRIIIALSHFALGGLGLLTGKEFHELGYSFSNHSQYIFSGLMILSFLSLLGKKGGDNMILLKEFDRMKLGHLGVAVSFFLLTLGIGNRMEAGQNQMSPLGYAVESIHDGYSGSQDLTHAPDLQENKAKPADATGLIILYVLLALALALLLFALCCAAICSGDPILAVVAVFASILVLVLVIRAMVRSVRRHSY